MKQVFISIIYFLLTSCSSTNLVSDTKQVDDIRETTNKNVFASCLITQVIELDSDIISYSFNSAKDSLSFQGKVYDSVTKEPLICAIVELLPCSIVTCTNIDGLYNLKYPINKCDTIKFSYVGYNTSQFLLKEYLKLQ